MSYKIHKKKTRETYDGVLGVVSVQVDTDDVHRCVGRGCRDDDLLGTTFQVSARPITISLDW